MDRCQKHKHYLKVLAACNRPIRTIILKKASKELILTLYECALNVAKGHIKLTDQQKQNLQKNKIALRTLLEKRKSTDRRKVLIQKGGVLLPVILPAIISAIGAIISGAISR